MAELHDIGPAFAGFALTPAEDVDLAPYVTFFLNWYGVTLAGAQRESVGALAGFHAADGQGDGVHPIGRDETLTISATVGINCLASAALAFDDIHFETTLHPAGPVAAAIMGVAARRKVSGRAALEALRVGMEIECRVALALFNGDTGAATGWYPTGLAGGIGAAAAVGRLLGQSEAMLQTSLALASARASGTRGTHGAMSAYWPPAFAGETGYSAAMLSLAGFTSRIEALTGQNGMLTQIAPRPNLEAALDGLGLVDLCATTACKLFPYGFIAYAPIQCARDLHDCTGGKNIAAMTIRVSEACAMLGGHELPANMFEAQVALRYIVAHVVLDKKAAFEPVPETFAVDPTIAALAKKINIEPVPGFSNDICELIVIPESQEPFTLRCEAAPGTAANPNSDSDIRAKFLRLTGGVLGRTKSATLLEQLEAIDQMEDIATLQ